MSPRSTAPGGEAADVVVILDEVVLASDEVERWRASWEASYLPAATERGLRLRGVWQGWTEDPELVKVVVCWSVPRIGRFWAARWQATDDPDVTAFWAFTDALAVRRERSVLEDLPIGAGA